MIRYLSIIVLLLTGLLAGPVAAQDGTETLVGDYDVDHGGFGGPVVKLSTVDGTVAAFVGGRGGWIINLRPGHTVVLGGGGYGLANDIEAMRFNGAVPEKRASAQTYLAFGYGGVEVEYVNRTQRLLHGSLQVLIGGGSVSFRDADHESLGDRYEDELFVVEPTAHLLLNVTSFLRIGGGISYRFVSGSSLERFSDADLSGPSAVLTFKFGSF
ncbi:MAG: hypothetical protein GVY18_09610 [Bacteroidetes bacterium]|jgi:hypothetical protein|nr:hypothetical protein [Bacteroidota bacterium]